MISVMMAGLLMIMSASAMVVAKPDNESITHLSMSIRMGSLRTTLTI